MAGDVSRDAARIAASGDWGGATAAIPRSFARASRTSRRLMNLSNSSLKSSDRSFTLLPQLLIVMSFRPKNPPEAISPSADVWSPLSSFSPRKKTRHALKSASRNSVKLAPLAVSAVKTSRALALSSGSSISRDSACVRAVVRVATATEPSHRHFKKFDLVLAERISRSSVTNARSPPVVARCRRVPTGGNPTTHTRRHPPTRTHHNPHARHAQTRRIAPDRRRHPARGARADRGAEHTQDRRSQGPAGAGEVRGGPGEEERQRRV